MPSDSQRVKAWVSTYETTYHTLLGLTKKVIQYEIQLFLYVLLRAVWSVSFRARCWFCVVMWRRERDLQLFHRICETLIFACNGGSSACQQEKWSEWSHTKLSHSFHTQKANFFETSFIQNHRLSWAYSVFLISQFGISRGGGLWGQDSGRTRHSHQESPHQVWRPRLFSHPEEYSAKDAEEGHLAVAGGQDPHRQPQTVAHLQIRLQKKPQRSFLHRKPQLFDLQNSSNHPFFWKHLIVKIHFLWLFFILFGSKLYEGL